MAVVPSLTEKVPSYRNIYFENKEVLTFLLSLLGISLSNIEGERRMEGEKEGEEEIKNASEKR